MARRPPPTLIARICALIVLAACSTPPAPAPLPPAPIAPDDAAPDDAAPDDAAPDDAAPAYAAPRFLIGEACLNASLQGHGMHLYPAFVGAGDTWRTDDAALRTPLLAAPRRFVVLDLTTTPVGLLDTGTDGSPVDPHGFAGRYTGARGPCNLPSKVAGGRVIRSDCVYAGGCGLAVAALDAPFAHLPALAATPICLDGADLLVDLDGDGAAERYPLADLGNATLARVPAHASCTAPAIPFSQTLGTDHVDLLGAVDLDADGRLELFIRQRTPTTRTLSLFAPTATTLTRLAITTLPR